MCPGDGWPLILLVFESTFRKTTFGWYKRSENDDVSIFRFFLVIFSKYPGPSKQPPFAAKTRKCHNFFQKSSKLNQTKSDKSTGLPPVPILSSGAFYLAVGHMPPMLNSVKRDIFGCFCQNHTSLELECFFCIHIPLKRCMYLIGWKHFVSRVPNHAITQIFCPSHAFTQSMKNSDFHAKALKLAKNMPFTKSRMV